MVACARTDQEIVHLKDEIENRENDLYALRHRFQVDEHGNSLLMGLNGLMDGNTNNAATMGDLSTDSEDEEDQETVDRTMATRTRRAGQRTKRRYKREVDYSELKPILCDTVGMIFVACTGGSCRFAALTFPCRSHSSALSFQEIENALLELRNHIFSNRKPMEENRSINPRVLLEVLHVFSILFVFFVCVLTASTAKYRPL